jgi:hypothetical protein
VGKRTSPKGDVSAQKVRVGARNVEESNREAGDGKTKLWAKERHQKVTFMRRK